MRAWVRSFTDAILGKVPGKPDRADTATRMALDADFGGRSELAIPAREPLRKDARDSSSDVDPIDDLARIVRDAQERDAEDERRLGQTRGIDRPLSYPRRRPGSLLTSRVLFVHGGAIAGRLSVGLAHIGAPLGVPVVARSGEVIDARALVDPNYGRSGAAGLSFLRGGELASSGRSWRAVARWRGRWGRRGRLLPGEQGTRLCRGRSRSGRGCGPLRDRFTPLTACGDELALRLTEALIAVCSPRTPHRIGLRS